MKNIIFVFTIIFSLIGLSKNQCVDLFKIQAGESEILKHIDALVIERLRIDTGYYVAESNQKKQANETFSKSLNEIVKSDVKYLTEFKNRYSEKLNDFMAKTKAADQIKNQESAERNKIINVEKFGPKKLFQIKHIRPVNTAEFSRDGRHIVTAANDGKAKIFNTESQKNLFEIDYGTNHTVILAAFSPDNKFVAAGARDIIEIYDMASKTEKYQIDTDYEFNSIQFSPDSKYIVVVSSDHTARIYDAVSGKKKFQINHANVVNQANFSPDGKYVITASYDHTAKIYDVASGKNYFKLRAMKISVQQNSVQTAEM